MPTLPLGDASGSSVGGRDSRNTELITSWGATWLSGSRHVGDGPTDNHGSVVEGPDDLHRLGGTPRYASKRAHKELLFRPLPRMARYLFASPALGRRPRPRTPHSALSGDHWWSWHDAQLETPPSTRCWRGEWTREAHLSDELGYQLAMNRR